jgi:tetratricopeptide (TPR) repeat protein
MVQSSNTNLITCPNPRCRGANNPDTQVCTSCKHELGICPSCGRVMSRTIGRCGWCGYRVTEDDTTLSTATQPIPITEAPIIVRFEASRSSVKEIIAEAYHQVALADLDMASATRILEKIRASLLTEPDAFKIWRQLDETIGTTEADALHLSIIALRTWFKEQLFGQQRLRLSKSFEQDQETGWREWLRTYAEGLSRWRLLLCNDLVEALFLFPETFHKPYDFRSATQLILHERWVDVYQFFTFLATHEFLHPYTRARLLVTTGQIYLYYFSPRDRALKFLQEAERLAPGLAIVSAVMGNYFASQNDFARSQIYLERAIQIASEESEAYCFMGDLADKKGNLEETHRWYQEAINNAPGDGLGYLRLIRLYGRPEFFERYKVRIVPLVEQAKAVDETGEYSSYLAIGDAYAATQQYETAHHWYDKAIQLESSRLDGYISKGLAYQTEGENRYDIAYKAYETAIQVAPETYDGYWGMGQLAEKRTQWTEAIEWYMKASQKQPEFYSGFQTRIGEMYWKLGDVDKAEANMLDALAHDHSNDAAVLNLADDYYKNQGKPEESIRLLDKIRELKGDAFESSYQNRLGNVYYYNEDYEKAAQHYLNAIRSNQKIPVYYSNLAFAYIQLEYWVKAHEYLKKAYDLHGDSHEFESDLLELYRVQEQALENSLPTSQDCLKQLDAVIAEIRKDVEQAKNKGHLSDQLVQFEQLRTFVVRYGANALTFTPVDSQIRIYISSDFSSFISDANQTDLSKEFLSLIETMRKRLQEKSGVRVPGLTFTELTEQDDIPSGTYRVEVMDVQIADGSIEKVEGSNPQENLLQNVESILNDNLDRLCGYQETANLLEQCKTDDCAQLEKDPEKLRMLTRRLKTILKEGGSIVDFTSIAKEINLQAIGGSGNRDQILINRPTSNISPGITKLILYVGKIARVNRAELALKMKDLQKGFFEDFGIIIPQVNIVDSLVGFQLQINDEKLPIRLTDREPDQLVSTELFNRADEMLTLEVVEFFLNKLKVNFPALVAVTQHYFSTEELTWQLRQRLSLKSSIKNLPRVLEELLDSLGSISQVENVRPATIVLPSVNPTISGDLA